MGLLLNNELIWVSVPKCASVSIEDAFLNSNLSFKKLHRDTTLTDTHTHHPVSRLYDEFGIHPTLCVKRDWFNRWLSGLEHVFNWIPKTQQYTPIRNWEDVDNQWIYDTFDTKFSNDLYSDDFNNNGWKPLFSKFIKEKDILENKEDYGKPLIFRFLCVLMSQNQWKLNKKCDYEFDISEMDKFSDFIYERFGERLDIKKLNEGNKSHSKIVVDDELKNWVWDKFEKPFEKRNSLI
jgi:hypothetical protein